VALIVVRIRPECIVVRGVCLTHQEPDEIIPPPVRDPFHVYKQLHRLPSDGRQLVEINFVVADRQGLQLYLMEDRWGFSAPFLLFARLEQVRELFDGENALLLIVPHHPWRDAVE
jgi:hypothetical protein